MTIRMWVVALAVLWVGCGTVASQPSDRMMIREREAYAGQESDASLFPSDAEVLSDEQIRRILDTRVSVLDGTRVALLHLNHRSLGRYVGGYYYHGGGTAAERAVDEILVRELRASPSIADAAYLPSLLLPPERSVPRLREAAARFQSDLVFVYATDCQLFNRYRAFLADESKAQCTAEAALLDVRTRIVPFTAKSAETFQVTEQKSDASFAETVERAETQASQAAVRATAHALLDFLAASRR
jgi:hypothetical protein